MLLFIVIMLFPKWRAMLFDFKKNAGWTENIALTMQIGLSMAGSVVFCFWIGRMIDKWLGTKGLFLIVFTILGVIGGAYLAYRNIMAAMVPKENTDDDNPHT